jgi:glycosyltransferase involved in cell wall biosynthesis
MVHAHISGHTPKSWLIALACGIIRNPLNRTPLLTVHGGQTTTYLAKTSSRRMLAAIVLRCFGTVIGVAPRIAEALENAGLPHQRSLVIPAFSPRGVHAGTPPDHFEALRRRHTPLLCASVTERPVHGVQVLLEALSILAGSHTTIGAAVFGSITPAIEELARRYQVEDRVAFLGELDRSAAQAVMAWSDAFVRPTLDDGDAISVREALMLGRPVIASAVVDRPPGVTLFRSGDATDLARAAKEVLVRAPVVPSTAEDFIERVLRLYTDDHA